LKSGFGVAEGHWKWHHSEAWVQFPIFLFAFHSNYGSILYQFRDKARYWSKIAFFASRRPHYGGSRRNIIIPFDMAKLERCAYLMVKQLWWYV